MYTWGCGWYGQTGHGHWGNINKPKLVDNSIVKEAKFIMASCGAKHTVALDTNGSVWFFGHKHSVGIEDFTDEKQFTPVRLDLPQYISEPIKYISSGEDHNIAISYSGIVYGFGKNTHKKINSSEKEYIFFEKAELDERAIIANCGANHSVMCDYRGLPYCWGCTANGRCGLNDGSDLNEKPNYDDVGAPQKITKLHSEFSKEQGALREEQKNMQDNEEVKFEEVKDKSLLMFPI